MLDFDGIIWRKNGRSKYGTKKNLDAVRPE
jgi:hypothetical protein